MEAFGVETSLFELSTENCLIFSLQSQMPEHLHELLGLHPFPAGCSLGTLTLLAEWPVVGREGSVTWDPSVLFSTPPSVVTQMAVGAAVSWAPWLHSWGHRGSFFQIQGQTVQSQRPNAPQEASLSACGSTYRGNTANANPFLGVLFRILPSCWTEAVSLLSAQSCPTLRPWTVAHQAPLSMGLSRQEYWSGLPCSPSGDLPDPGIKLVSPAPGELQVDSLLLSH